MRSKFLVAALAGLFMAGSACAQMAAADMPPPVDPQNVLNIDLSNGGRVKVQLRPDKAPNSVERIKVLARRHFYDGLTFHRVIEGFMAQGGDPKGTGEGGSDLPDVKAEFNDIPHVRGVMAMARAENPDSANSQFFLMLQPNLSLDGNYTAIGRVIAGMQYADAIEKGEPPANPTKIVRMTIESDDQGIAPVAFVPPPAAAAVPSAESAKEAKKAKKAKKKMKAEDARAPAAVVAEPTPSTAPSGPAPAAEPVPEPMPTPPSADPVTDTPPAPQGTDSAVSAVSDEATNAAVKDVASEEVVATPQ